MPDRRALYVGLFLLSAVLFGAAGYAASRLTRPAPGTSQDDWWRSNLTRAIGIWGLVEAPTLLGTMAYLITHDFRTLIATLTGLLVRFNDSLVALRSALLDEMAPAVPPARPDTAHDTRPVETSA